ncbi:hypothetical protein AB0764_26870 (plasmid) [Priestia megaterium]|uniref:hypothetical protein n=1 Tax=Priestia megaterium TaxID=1404 RepID=UPI00351EC42A
MLFSELYSITKSKDESWFDPILDVDTKLFIDPFLLFSYSEQPFNNAHSKIIEFFNEAFILAAKSRGFPDSLSYKKLVSMLTFPEVEEICLGYTNKSTGGSGGGEGFSHSIAVALIKSIRIGIKEIDHFEEIGILEKGIGRDRISDICGNIIKEELITYTQDICSKHEVPLQEFKVRNSKFDFKFKRWENNSIFLPLNPTNNKPILLVPEIILRELPSINADGFLDWAWSNENEMLRTDFNFEIKSQINKEDIMKIASDRIDLLENYVNYVEGKGSLPYNLDKDPSGIYKWYEQSKGVQQLYPIKLATPKTDLELAELVKRLIQSFNSFIVNNSGYKLLWNEIPLRPKKEEASQLLFFGLIKEHCRANNIDFSREVNQGRGPVDFKFSSGYQNRVLIEVKRASSSKLKQGLINQLPQYLESEGIHLGYYVVIVQKEEEYKKISNLKGEAKKLSEELDKFIDIFVIDATHDKPSASNI